MRPQRNATLLIVFLAGYCLLVGTTVFADTTFQQELAHGQAALKNGAYTEALEILSRLLPIAPDHQALNFAYGMACLGSGDPSRAELAFQRVLQNNPGNTRARLELARALAATQRYTEAKRELQQALDANLPPNVERNVLNYLQYIQNLEQQKRHFSLKIQAGGFYDTNVNVGPDADIVPIRPIFFGPLFFNELAVGAESKPQRDAGTSLEISGNYSMPISGSGWIGDFGATAYASRFNTENDYDVFYYQINGTAHRRFAAHMIQFPTSHLHLYRGGESLLQSTRLGARYLYHTTTGQRVALRTDTQWRNYTDRDERDGISLFMTIGLDQFVGKKKHMVGMSITHSQDWADNKVYQKNGFRMNLSGSWQLPWGLSAHTALHHIFEAYEEREPLAPEDREDKQIQLTGSIRKQFGSSIYMDLHHTYTRNNSTFKLYDYNRNLTNLSIAYQF